MIMIMIVITGTTTAAAGIAIGMRTSLSSRRAAMTGTTTTMGGDTTEGNVIQAPSALLLLKSLSLLQGASYGFFAAGSAYFALIAAAICVLSAMGTTRKVMPLLCQLSLPS